METLINNTSYLTNRKQRVTVKSSNNYDSVYSNWDKIQHQVPQGFVLGPLHLLLSINLVSTSVLFEDTSIIIILWNY
jgi:hypothetical protein